MNRLNSIITATLLCSSTLMGAIPVFNTMDISTSAAVADALAQTSPYAVASVASARSEIVFVESNVRDYQTLLGSVDSNAEVHVLSAAQDGLAQIAGILGGRSGIDSIHILSHGSQGSLQLGVLNLSVDNLQDRAADLATIGSVLTSDGDILLYGCSVAKGNAGATFVNELARLTGADVAASTDVTGAADLGGDWVLEHANGAIETAVAFDTARGDYGHLLATTLDFTTDHVFTNSDTTLTHAGYVLTTSAGAWDTFMTPFGGEATTTGASGTTITLTKSGGGTFQLDGFKVADVGVLANLSLTVSGTLSGVPAGTDTFSVPDTLSARTTTNLAGKSVDQVTFAFTAGADVLLDDIILGDAISNAAPTITGAVAGQAVNDNATLTPFSGITLADTDGDNISMTITLDTNAKGVLSGTGLSGTGPYTLASDTPANVQTRLQALVFNPTDNRVAPASTETTTFSLVANDGIVDSTTNSTTTVVSTSINDAPTDIALSSTSVNQSGGVNATVGTLNATDPDTGESFTYSLVAGSGDTNNASFNISTTTLRANDSSTLSAGTYSIRVNVNDGDANFEKAFTITVADDIAPTLSSLSPADNAIGIAANTNLVITLNEDVAKGTGNIVIKKTSDNTTVETIDVTSGQVSISNAVVTINPSVTLGLNTQYYVQIDATALDDSAGNSYPGIADTTSWSFTTAANNAPTIATINDFTLLEDFASNNISVTVNDADSDNLRISVDINDTSIITAPVTQTDWITSATYSAAIPIEIRSVNDAYGSVELNITVEDVAGSKNTQIFILTVTPQDDAPVATNMAATVGPNSQEAFSNFTPTYTDVENDNPIMLKIETLPTVGTFETNTTDGNWTVISSAPFEVPMSELANYRFNAGDNSGLSANVNWSIMTSPDNTYGNGLWSNTATGVVTIIDPASNQAPDVNITMDGNDINATVVTIDEDGQTNPIYITFSDDYTPEAFLVEVVDSNDSSKVSLDDGNFNITRIADNNISVIITPKANVYGDVTITLGAFDGDKNGTKSFTLRINNINDAPTDITLSNSSIAENNTIGATIGTLSTIDVDLGDTHTYSFACTSTGADDASFSIDGNILKASAVFDYETKNSYEICIRTTDSENAIFDKNITIAIADVNENTGGGTTTPPPPPATQEPEPEPEELVVVEPEPEELVVVAPEPEEPVVVAPEAEPTPEPEEPVVVEPEVKHQLGDVTVSSELEGTQTQTDVSTGDVKTSTTTTNDADEPVAIEVVAKASGDVKASHTMTVGEQQTKAESELPNTNTTIRSDKSVETKATLNSNGAEIKVVANPDGSASHTVKLGEKESSANSDIRGAQTRIGADGKVRTSVAPINYSDANGYTIEAVVITDESGQTFTSFVKRYGDRVEQVQDTTNQATPFEAGNNARIYEDAEDNNRLKLKIKTPVTKRLQF